MTNFLTESKNQNIEIAKSIIELANISDYYYCSYSDTNGVSVYFKNSKGIKIRVSTHSVSNINRILNEIHLSFDQKTIGLGGKIGIKSNLKMNLFTSNLFGY